MKHITIICLIFAMSLFFRTYATEQEPDRLIIKGDTMLLHALPLEHWKKQNKWNKPLFPDSLSGVSSGCWRGYIAYWEIIDNRLYLTNIFNGERTAKVNLKSLFAEKVKDGRVYPEWFSDTVTAYQGKLLYYMHMGFSSIFEHEFEYSFEKGLLKNASYFDNSLSKNTPFYGQIRNPNSTIDSLINWQALPPITETIKVQLSVEVNELGHVDSILSIRGNNEIFIQEAIRVARLFKKMPVIYKRGKHMKFSFFLPFTFSEKKQKENM
ncbi:hypothetical protein VJ786_10515 [Sphingobacterium sp. PU5-4]|uniref:TonB C-terminal domain-containing protein n=1 Tax=Sphingobacterium tenebrionis TaxID=3111775 RepID=A0ABU8I6W2_9SPHI